jgi:hypothetical protein
MTEPVPDIGFGSLIVFTRFAFVAMSFRFL